MVQNPPHQEEVWQQAFFKWQQAINILEGIPEGTFAYQIAKEKLSIYKINYAAIATRLKYSKANSQLFQLSPNEILFFPLLEYHRWKFAQAF